MNATTEPHTAEHERASQTGRVTLDPEPHDEGSSQHGGGPGRPPEPPPPPRGRRRPEGNNGRAWILSVLLVVCLVCTIVLTRMLGRARSNDG